MIFASLPGGPELSFSLCAFSCLLCLWFSCANKGGSHGTRSPRAGTSNVIVTRLETKYVLSLFRLVLKSNRLHDAQTKCMRNISNINPR
jgi:hypothetical protein